MRLADEQHRRRLGQNSYLFNHVVGPARAASAGQLCRVPSSVLLRTRQMRARERRSDNYSDEISTAHVAVPRPARCHLWLQHSTSALVKSRHMRCNKPCPLYPNSDRESGLSRKAMSALPPKADVCAATSDVR